MEAVEGERWPSTTNAGATRDHIDTMIPLCLADHCHETNPRECSETLHRPCTLPMPALPCARLRERLDFRSVKLEDLRIVRNDTSIGGMGMIVRFCVPAIALIAIGSFTAGQAQAQSFCDLEGTELLQAIDGLWSLEQGAGGAQAAGMAIPLPGKPAATFGFTYLDTDDASLVTGPDVPDDTFMTPVEEGGHEVVSSMIAAASSVSETGECSVENSPILIASNVTSNSLDLREHSELTTRTCAAIGMLMAAPNTVLTGKPEDTEFWGGFLAQDCSDVEAAKGAVVTTMLLRFSSSDAASGVVLFEGGAQGSGQNVGFTGAAPITLTRQ